MNPKFNEKCANSAITDSEGRYLQYDPFAGDESDIKCQSVKIVTVRKDRQCWMGLGPDETPHGIPKGQRARFEKAIVDGEWCSYYVCLPCIDKWLMEIGK
jgi:hypothetical protein